MPTHPTAQVFPLGDSAAVIRFGESIDPVVHRIVRTCFAALSRCPPAGVLESVPAYTTVTVYYDPASLTFGDLSRHLTRLVANLAHEPELEPRTVEIPVQYGGDCGPDLDFVARHNQLTPGEVIQIHSSATYLVYLIGFAPGFPYLGGMPETIAAPRRNSPRLTIPAGSVGIAGTQTGIYPLETPGGWQLIGRTSLALFQPDRSPPTLLQVGDHVRFRPVNSLDEIC